MSARGRAEAVVAVMYVLALPFVLILALRAEIFIQDATWSPTLPYELVLLLDSLPAFVTGALLFMLMRLTIYENVPNVSLARWPVRLAPIVLAAAVPTGLGLWLVVVRGARGLNGLIVLPALALWGAATGEWIAHRYRTRGFAVGTLLRRSSLCAAAGIGSLMIAAWVLRSPHGELELARRKCEREYASARTAADSAMTDRWTPTVDRELGTASCAALRHSSRPMQRR